MTLDLLLLTVSLGLLLGMTITHSITWTWTQSGDSESNTENVSAGLEKNLDEAVADSETDLEITYEIDQSAMQSFYMVSDQDVTVETNDGAAPDDTFSLQANIPLVWTANSNLTNPVTTDITALFVTNASGSTANLKIRALVDPTP